MKHTVEIEDVSELIAADLAWHYHNYHSNEPDYKKLRKALRKVIAYYTNPEGYERLMK